MIQEDKQLLLKDLCGRLPYGVKIRYHYKRNDKVIDEDRELDFSDVETLKYNNEHPQDDWCEISWKPYLRPMSSMTKEEKLELCKRAYVPDEIKTLEKKIEVIEINAKNVSDFYNEHHFDYRGLIDKNMALEATEEMYNFN